MQERHNSHKFALYFQDLTKSTKCISDKDVVHRITRVLRLRKGDSCILFNKQMHVEIAIEDMAKDAVHIVILKHMANISYEPAITFLLPLLKKDAFEQAVYHLVSCGVTVIQPVITKQCHQTEFSAHEWERLHKILIEACQVSKNHSMTILERPISLAQALTSYSSGGIFFDPAGQKIDPTLIQKNIPLTLLIGPEGDLTDQEKKLVKDKGFQFCSLTPTILKADQAALLAAGMIRSLV